MPDNDTDHEPSITDRFRCALLGHNHAIDHAVDWQPDGYTRDHGDGSPPKPIPACTLVEVCQRCGDERELYAPAEVAERHDIPTEWGDEPSRDGKTGQ